MTRSNFISRGFAALAGGLVLAKSERLLAQDHSGHSMPAEPTKSEKPFEYDEPLKVHGYKPVITPNVRDLEFTFEDGYKTFRLSAEVVKHEFAPGMVAECWGYNGSSPGPTIQVVEGDRVRIYVTNRLPEKTSVHWHGVLLPAGMDGVAGLNQKHIMPGETFKYEFVIRQKAATLMYHPHSDEMVQMALGMMGMFIVHAKKPPRRIDRDYAIILQTWDVKPGTARPNPLLYLQPPRLPRHRAAFGADE
jgi:manganese oxidase